MTSVTPCHAQPPQTRRTHTFSCQCLGCRSFLPFPQLPVDRAHGDECKSQRPHSTNLSTRTGMRSGYFSLMREASAWRFSVDTTTQRYGSKLEACALQRTMCMSSQARRTQRVFLLEALVAHNHGCFAAHKLEDGMSVLCLLCRRVLLKVMSRRATAMCTLTTTRCHAVQL